MLNYRKTMLAASLLALIGVWMGCSNDTSPVASYSASKTNTDEFVADAYLKECDKDRAWSWPKCSCWI